MTLRKRRILFAVLFFIFLVASPAIILYSLGYKLDTKTFTVQKTGGIFVDTEYDKYSVDINGKIHRDVVRSAFFAQGALAPNLIPQQYKVEISKEGYEPWQKYLEVKSGLVTEAKNIFLMPKNTTPALNIENATDFIFSKSEENIGYIAKDEIVLRNAKDETENKISLPKNLKNPKLIGFSADEKNIFFKTDASLFKTSYETSEIAEIKTPKKTKYSKILASPKDKNILYALASDNSLYEINFKENSQTVFLKDILDFTTNNENIFYATLEPVNFYRQKIGENKPVQLTSVPVKNFGKKSKIEPIFDDTIAVIDENSDLYIYYAYLKKFQKMANNIKYAKTSSDLSKILYYSDNEIYVYYISPSYPNKRPGETDLIGRFSEKVEDAKWFSHDNHHLIFKISGTLKIIELDGRDKRNAYDIAQHIGKFEFNNTDKSVYYLKDNGLNKIVLIEK